MCKIIWCLMASRNNTKLFIKSSVQVQRPVWKCNADETLKKFPGKAEDLLSKKKFLLRRSPVHLFRRPKFWLRFGANLFSRPRQCTINFIADVVVLAQHYEIRFVGSSLDFSFFLSAVSSSPQFSRWRRTLDDAVRSCEWLTCSCVEAYISNFEAKGGRTESAI